MKALTLWQPWASLVIEGFKPFEFRTWPAPRFIWGQRIVVHAAARPVDGEEIKQLLDPDSGRLAGSLGSDGAKVTSALELLTAVDAGKLQLPTGAGLGTAIVCRPRRAIDIFAGRMDPDDIDTDIWGWPLTEIERFAKPVPRRGRQQFWDWDPPETKGALL